MTEKKTASFPYASTVKNLPIIAFRRIKSPKGDFSYKFFARNASQVLGLSDFEEHFITTDGCLDNIHWSDKDRLAHVIKLSEQELSPAYESFRIITPNGNFKWIIGYSTPKKQKNGSIQWDGLWMDVTGDKGCYHFQSLVLRHIQEGIVAFDAQGTIMIATPALAELLNCPIDELHGKSVFSLFQDTAAAEALKHYISMSCQEDNEKHIFTTTLHSENYQQTVLEIALSKTETFYIAVFRDITKQQSKEMHLRYLAYHDIETGVANYAYLKEVFPRALEQAITTKTQIAILSISPDSIGQIKAVSGHAMSSRIVTGMADKIRCCLGIEDVLICTSGHHFTVLLTGIEFTLEIQSKVDAILSNFDTPIIIDDLEFDLSVSVGVCFCPQDGRKIEDLITYADLALEKARITDKGTMRIYNNDYSMTAVIKSSMRKRLKEAIEKKEIIAYFQPQVDIPTGNIVGLEALARWRDNDGRIIPPAEFIPEAEEFGMIDALTEIILDQSCKWNQKWFAMGLCNVPVAVNISGRQFHNESQLLRLVERALEKSGLPPYLLELELTESSAMYDPKNAQRVLQSLLDNNIRCALDDFGTGYSSLNVLRSFPMKKIKIDRSFVLDLGEKKNLEIVRATIAMAHALNLSVLAEGVENKQHFEILKALNCDIIQGYLFSRPIPPEETELLLKRWDASLAATGKPF